MFAKFTHTGLLWTMRLDFQLPIDDFRFESGHQHRRNQRDCLHLLSIYLPIRCRHLFDNPDYIGRRGG